MQDDHRLDCVALPSSDDVDTNAADVADANGLADSPSPQYWAALLLPLPPNDGNAVDYTAGWWRVASVDGAAPDVRLNV